MQVQIEFEGAKELAKHFGDIQNFVPKDTAEALNRTAFKIQQQLIEKTTQEKAIDVGHFRDSWHLQVAKPQNLTAQVGTHLVPHYAPDIEYGTRPHDVSPKKLMNWAMRKLGDPKLAYAVAGKIAKKGTKERHIFRPVAENTINVLNQEVEKLAKQLESKM